MREWENSRTEDGMSKVMQILPNDDHCSGSPCSKRKIIDKSRTSMSEP